MANIILAYIIGALCGVGYMYLKYSKTMQRHISELEQIRLNNARIEGQMGILNQINGIEEDSE